MATRAERRAQEVERQRLAFMQKEQERLARAEEQRMREKVARERQAKWQAGFDGKPTPRQIDQSSTVSMQLPPNIAGPLSGAFAQIPKNITTDAVPAIPELVPAPNTAVRPPSTAVRRPVTIQTAVTNTTTDGLNTGTVTANNKNAPLPSLLGNNAAYSSLLGQGEYAGPSTGMNRFIQILERMAVPGKSPAQAFAEGNLSLSAQEAAAAQSYLDRGLSQQKLQAQQKLLQAEAEFKNREEQRRIDELGIKTADYFTKDMSKDEATRLIQVIKSELTSLGNKDLLARVNRKADEFGWGTSEETYQNLAVRYRRLLLKEELAGKPTSPLEKLTRVVNSLEVEGTPAQVKKSVVPQGNIGDPSVPIISLDAGF